MIGIIKWYCTLSTDMATTRKPERKVMTNLIEKRPKLTILTKKHDVEEKAELTSTAGCEPYYYWSANG